MVTGGSISAHSAGGCEEISLLLRSRAEEAVPAAGADRAPAPPGAGSRLCRAQVLRDRGLVQG